MTSPQWPEERSKLVRKADWLVRLLPTESHVELQPEDIWVCDKLRQIIDQLWRFDREQIVATDLASLKHQPHDE